MAEFYSKHENPQQTGQLVTSEKMEREECQRVLLCAAFIAAKKVSELRRGSVTNEDLKRINLEIRRQPYEVLLKRVAALQQQNPGLLVEAMKMSGYDVGFDKDGNVSIKPKENLLGKPLTLEEFERI